MRRPSNGRRAALPAAGYRPVERKQGNEGLVVRFVPENPREQPVDFDFAGWPVSRQLQAAFADAFSARTRGGARCCVGGTPKAKMPIGGGGFTDWDVGMADGG